MNPMTYEEFKKARVDHPEHKEKIEGDGRLEVWSYTPASPDCLICRLLDTIHELHWWTEKEGK